MFAGERMTFHRPIRIGDPLRRETELVDISLKSGGTGTLVFATVRNRIFAADALAIEEERRTVFREEVKAGEKNRRPGERRPPPISRGGGRSPDAVLLFRFSALTFNSHRIHYDRAWAMDVEGYPGLVVHGPLTSTLLIDFARDHSPGHTILTYTTQARAPSSTTRPSSCAADPPPTDAELSYGR